MNESKRQILLGVVQIVNQIRDDEAKDLADTPDNIEFSEHCDAFRSNCSDLDYINYVLKRVILRKC
jgi:hypothetical protein